MKSVDYRGIRELAEQLRKEDDAEKLAALADKASGEEIPGAFARGISKWACVLANVALQPGSWVDPDDGHPYTAPEARQELAHCLEEAADDFDPEKVGEEIERRVLELCELLNTVPEVMGYAWRGPSSGNRIREGVNRTLKALGFGRKSHYYVKKVY